MNLQERVLALLGEQGRCPAKDMQHSLKGVDHIALDCCLSALLRVNKITLAAGHYDLARPGAKRVGDGEVNPPEGDSSTPPAAQRRGEFLPPPETQVCNSCKIPKPVCEFRLTNNNGRRAKDCNACHGKRTSAGHQVRVESNGASGEPIRAALVEDIGGGASKQPVIADRVFAQVKARRENIQEQIQSLGAELQVCDQFIALYEKYAEGAT